MYIYLKLIYKYIFHCLKFAIHHIIRLQPLKKRKKAYVTIEHQLVFTNPDQLAYLH